MPLPSLLKRISFIHSKAFPNGVSSPRYIQVYLPLVLDTGEPEDVNTLSQEPVFHSFEKTTFPTSIFTGSPSNMIALLLSS